MRVTEQYLDGVVKDKQIFIYIINEK